MFHLCMPLALSLPLSFCRGIVIPSKLSPMLGHLTLSCCFFPLLDFWLDLSLPAHYPLCLSPSLAAALVCRCCFPCTDAPMLIAILMKVGPILNRQFKTLATVLSLAFCILIRGWEDCTVWSFWTRGGIDQCLLFFPSLLRAYSFEHIDEMLV